MYKIKKPLNNSSKNRSLIIAGLATLLVVAGLFVGQRLLKSGDPTVATTKPGQELNLAPPTATDKAETEQNKDKIATQLDGQTKTSTDTTPAPTNSTGKKAGTVVISSSSQTNDIVRVASYVSNVFEEGGVCTLTMTNGTKTVTKTGNGFQNASYTQCMPFNIARADFATAGAWSTKVSYESATTSGESPSLQVEVK